MEGRLGCNIAGWIVLVLGIFYALRTLAPGPVGPRSDLIFLVFMLALIPAIIAYSKGHSFLGWWLFGLFLLIVALPWSIFLKKTLGAIQREQLAAGRKRCQHCAEWIEGPARICPYCRQETA